MLAHALHSRQDLPSSPRSRLPAPFARHQGAVDDRRETSAARVGRGIRTRQRPQDLDRVGQCRNAQEPVSRGRAGGCRGPDGGGDRRPPQGGKSRGPCRPRPFRHGEAGAPKPDISSPETFKRTLLAAKSIAYSSQGASGIYFVTLIERLGIAAEVKAKHKDTAGAVGELLTTGEAEIGIQQIPELAAVPGVEVVGPFPGELQVITVFSAALDTKAKDNEAAKAFVKFISAPAAAAAYKAKGLDPT